MVLEVMLTEALSNEVSCSMVPSISINPIVSAESRVGLTSATVPLISAFWPLFGLQAAKALRQR